MTDQRSPAVPAEPVAIGEQQIVDEARRRYTGHGRFQRVFAEGAGWGLKHRASPTVSAAEPDFEAAALALGFRVRHQDGKWWHPNGTAIEACPMRECSSPMAYETAIKRARDYIEGLPVQPATRPDREALEAWSIIEQLRAPEGAVVCLFCDNPEFGTGANNALEVCDDWTGWKHVRFEGDTLLEALRVALRASKGEVSTRG